MATSATVLRLFVDALEELGVDWRKLLVDCEIDPEQLSNAEAWIPQDRFERVWVAAQEITNDPCIGLHCGERLRVHAVNLFGYLMLSSATLGAGIRRVARYQRALAGAPWVELAEDGDSLRLRVGAAVGDAEFRAIHAEYVAALVLRVMGWVSEFEVRPEAVSFRHEARGPLSEYTRVLRCETKFGAPHNELVLGAATLARPSRHAEESIARLHEEFAERLLSIRDETEIADRVRCLLAESLESGPAELASVAQQLGMSARSLQRRLSDEGASFRELLDGLRCQVAREHLERCRLPIAGVAHLTGFSDVSAFTRAVSRWFGATPARLRERANSRLNERSDQVH
jgi:AraC-like DNA-binding protein